MDIRVLRENQAKYIEEQGIVKKLFAKDAMTKAVVVHEDDEIKTIIKKLKSEDTNYVIVLDKNDNFLGEISVEKLIKIIAHTSLSEPFVKILGVGYRRGINFTTAKDHVTLHRNIVDENEDLVKVLKLVDKKGFNYIPVSKNNKIVGLITPSSLLNLLSKH